MTTYQTFPAHLLYLGKRMNDYKFKSYTYLIALRMTISPAQVHRPTRIHDFQTKNRIFNLTDSNNNRSTSRLSAKLTILRYSPHP